MELFSWAGLIGALLGLIVGWIDYKIVGGIVERKLRDTDRSQTAAEKADYERRIGLFRRILLTLNVTVFPIVGYFMGRTITSL